MGARVRRMGRLVTSGLRRWGGGIGGTVGNVVSSSPGAARHCPWVLSQRFRDLSATLPAWQSPRPMAWVGCSALPSGSSSGVEMFFVPLLSVLINGMYDVCIQPSLPPLKSLLLWSKLWAETKELCVRAPVCVCICVCVGGWCYK